MSHKIVVPVDPLQRLIPVTLLASDIPTFFRIANLVESDEPRIAYLSRLHAFEIAHDMDRSSTGRGVRQFKTSLLKRLEQDEEFTYRRRKERSAVREVERVYHVYKDYIARYGALTFNLDDSQREKLIKAREIASALYDILKKVTNGDAPQAIEDGESIRPFDSEKIPETLASGIQRFLRIANLVESEEPRIAYLCRFYAFEKACEMDKTSNGIGVRQFKTSLLQRLEQDDDFTRRRRMAMSDESELKRVYNAYTDYIVRHGTTCNLDNSQGEKLITAHRIASVLDDIIKKVTSGNDTQTVAISSPTSQVKDHVSADEHNMDLTLSYATSLTTTIPLTATTHSTTTTETSLIAQKAIPCSDNIVEPHLFIKTVDAHPRHSPTESTEATSDATVFYSAPPSPQIGSPYLNSEDVDMDCGNGHSKHRTIDAYFSGTRGGKEIEPSQKKQKI